MKERLKAALSLFIFRRIPKNVQRDLTVQIQPEIGTMWCVGCSHFYDYYDDLAYDLLRLFDDLRRSPTGFIYAPGMPENILRQSLESTARE